MLMPAASRADWVLAISVPVLPLAPVSLGDLWLWGNLRTLLLELLLLLLLNLPALLFHLLLAIALLVELLAHLVSLLLQGALLVVLFLLLALDLPGLLLLLLLQLGRTALLVLLAFHVLPLSFHLLILLLPGLAPVALFVQLAANLLLLLVEGLLAVGLFLLVSRGAFAGLALEAGGLLLRAICSGDGISGACRFRRQGAGFILARGLAVILPVAPFRDTLFPAAFVVGGFLHVGRSRGAHAFGTRTIALLLPDSGGGILRGGWLLRLRFLRRLPGFPQCVFGPASVVLLGGEILGRFRTAIGNLRAGRTRQRVHLLRGSGIVWRGGKTGVAGISALALGELAAAVGAGLPEGGIGVVDIYDVDVVVYEIVIAATPPAVVIPATPVAPVKTAISPVEVITEPASHSEPDAEGDQRGRDILLHINNPGVVLRNIDDLGIRRDDADDFLLGDDVLLRCVHEIPCGASLCAQGLDGIHDVGRLDGEGFAERGGPLEVFVHPFENVGILGEGLDAVVPRLAGDE